MSELDALAALRAENARLITLLESHGIEWRPPPQPLPSAPEPSRLFPNQDTMPKGGFGNLIALPLQKWPREKACSVFVDAELRPQSKIAIV